MSKGFDDPNDPFGMKLKALLDRERTMKGKPKDTRRDIWIHGAVTIMNTQKEIMIPGETENEICQFAFNFDYNKIPVPEFHVKNACDDLAARMILRMRAFGLIK